MAHSRMNAIICKPTATCAITCRRPAQLDELRHWSNLDDHNGALLQFLLAGHPSLAERLNRHKHANLKQRIGCRFNLPALTLDETQRYIAHRCQLAGAARLLFERALINTVADALLLQAFLRGGRSVEIEDVRMVSRDLDLSYAPIIKRPEVLSNSGVADDPDDDLL